MTGEGDAPRELKAFIVQLGAAHVLPPLAMPGPKSFRLRRRRPSG
jgi:hypothetical protein